MANLVTAVAEDDGSSAKGTLGGEHGLKGKQEFCLFLSGTSIYGLGAGADLGWSRTGWVAVNTGCMVQVARPLFTWVFISTSGSLAAPQIYLTHQDLWGVSVCPDFSEARYQLTLLY